MQPPEHDAPHWESAVPQTVCSIHSLVLTILPGREVGVQRHKVTDAKLMQLADSRAGI